MTATAAFGVCEVLMMRVGTPERYGLIARWAHVLILILIASFVWFVRMYLDAGRPWLAWTAIGTRAFASLVLNFLSPVNLNYTAIARLRSVPLLGEWVSIPEGVLNPWDRAAQLGNAIFFVYLVDATVTVWRRGERRRALMVGGSMILFVAVAATHAALLHAGMVRSPYIVCFSSLGIMLAMGYELSLDVLRARELAIQLRASEAELRESEQRMSLAAKAASLGMWAWDIARDEIWLSPTAHAFPGPGKPEQISFARYLSAVHPDDRDRFRESVERSRDEGIDFEREYRVVWPDGEVRWIASQGAVERDAAGTALRMRGVSMDITPRKAAEAELLRQREQLAHLSRVTMVSELSGSLAHELNQPLTARPLDEPIQRPGTQAVKEQGHPEQERYDHQAPPAFHGTDDRLPRLVRREGPESPGETGNALFRARVVLEVG
jgi:two-component system sensor kinase FixL